MTPGAKHPAAMPEAYATWSMELQEAEFSQRNLFNFNRNMSLDVVFLDDISYFFTHKVTKLIFRSRCCSRTLGVSQSKKHISGGTLKI